MANIMLMKTVRTVPSFFRVYVDIGFDEDLQFLG